jgi:YidC/Oxa1 family membrane protein insertase
MENARLIIAIGISFLIFFLWSMFIAPKQPEKPVEVAQQTSQTQASGKSQSPAVTAVVPTEKPAIEKAPPAPVVSQNGQPVRSIEVETALYKMRLSERGAAVTGVVLKNYRETIEKDSPLKELIHKEAKQGTVLISLTGDNAHDMESAVYATDFKEDTLDAREQPGRIRFQYKTPAGLVVEKIYRFVPDSYLVGLTVNLYNATDKTYQGELALQLQNKLPKNSGRYTFEGPSGLLGNKLEQIAIKKIKDQSYFSGKIEWIAIEDRYFMTSILPKEPLDGRMELANGDDTVKNQLVISTGDLLAHQNKSLEFQLFMGPKSYKLLKTYHNKLDQAINFGWFDFLAKPCLWFMNFIYGFIPNYGVAIIILTIISRGIFWPLARKSYKSMGEMRRLQPLMQEIREKYKDDKARINQETMALYRTYKVNPVGGCLPMLIQLPVFFALYRMLYSAIELRHAPFFGWITDLSAPDRLFHFSFKIPFMDPPYGIPVLTLVMGASMFIQQKMSPQAGDPTQAKMMMLMPIIFTVIFINFSSGLVIYWLVSNIFSIAQQYYTQKQMA